MRRIMTVDEYKRTNLCQCDRCMKLATGQRKGKGDTREMTPPTHPPHVST